MFLIVAGVTIGLSHLADFPVAERVHNPNVNRADWGRMLRVAGYVPTWLVVAISFALIDAGRPRAGVLRDRWTRAVLLMLGAAGAGAGAEAIKLLVRRGRPLLIDGEASYLFRAFADGPLDSSGLGMPSSHAAVAFGAAFVLCRLHPRASAVWITLAIGCGATRVLSGAHFVSDVVASGFLGYAIAWGLWRWHMAHVANDALIAAPASTAPAPAPADADGSDA